MTETKYPARDKIQNMFRPFENSNFDIVSNFGLIA
jgi:hypothetical protein